MSNAWIATFFLIVIAAISSFFYLDNLASVKRFKDSKRIKSLPKFRFIYFYIMLTTLVISPLCFFQKSSYLLQWHNSAVWLYSGLALATVGISLFVTSKLNLGSNYNPCYQAYVPKELIQSGIYKFIRHPIYTANILVVCGFFVASGSWWLLPNVVMLAISCVISSKNEELALAQEFPEYLNYIQLTGAFLPKIYKPITKIQNTEEILPINNVDNSQPPTVEL